MEKEIIQIDCCIIGGSTAGLWTALELVKSGKNVLVVDKEYIGQEKNNIDVCLNYNLEGSMQKIALKAQKKWLNLKENNPDLMIDIRGSVSMALEHNQEDEFNVILEEQKKLDADLGSFTINDKQALKTLLKTTDLGEQVKGALVSAADLSLNHQNCLDFLRKELIQNGAKFWGSDKVIDFDIEDNKITSINTKESIIKADNIIIACGAKAYKLLDQLNVKMPLRPARCHIVEYTSKIVMPKQIIHYKNDYGEYICKPMINGRNLLIYTGMYDQLQATWSNDINNQTVNSSMLEMARILPDLEYADIQEAQTAQLAITPDRIPYFGKADKYNNLYVCLGLHANGYLLAPYLAEEMAKLINKKPENPDVKHLNPNRFMEK